MKQDAVEQIRHMHKEIEWFFVCTFLVLRYMLDCSDDTLHRLVDENVTVIRQGRYLVFSGGRFNEDIKHQVSKNRVA